MKSLTPRAYWLKKGIKRPGKGKQQPATKWNRSTVTKILSLQEYCGNILYFETYSKSYENKKRLENDHENWVIFKNVHESIIEQSVFEQVQQKREKSASAAPTKASITCSPAFWSALIVAAIFTSISIRATRRSSISTAPTIRATVGAELPPTMSEWIFWNRWCLVKSGA